MGLPPAENGIFPSLTSPEFFSGTVTLNFSRFELDTFSTPFSIFLDPPLAATVLLLNKAPHFNNNFYVFELLSLNSWADPEEGP